MTVYSLEIEQWVITEHSLLTDRLNKQHVTVWSGPLQKGNLLTEFEIDVINMRLQVRWNVTKWHMDKLCWCRCKKYILKWGRKVNKGGAKAANKKQEHSVAHPSHKADSFKTIATAFKHKVDII